MRHISNLIKKHDFKTAYEKLKSMNYTYIIHNFEHDFKRISSSDKFNYLIYLTAKEKTINNILLICDFLLFTDTFFYDVHTVIYDYLCQGIKLFPYNSELLEWIVSTYENNPDSPFDFNEMTNIKSKLNNI